jgi:hypothetical protein
VERGYVSCVTDLPPHILVDATNQSASKVARLGAIIPVYRARSSANPGRHHIGLIGQLRRKTQDNDCALRLVLGSDQKFLLESTALSEPHG